MIYCSEYIVTQNAGRDVLRNAAMRVEGSRITDVGPRGAVCALHPADPVLDLGETAIMPGLINGHTHIPMSALRGYADDLALMDWLQNHIFPAEARWRRELVRDAARFSCLELVRHGCTAFYDMYMHEPEVAEAVAEVGCRAVLGENVTQFFPAINAASLDDYEARVRDFAAAWKDHPLVTPSVAPHAVYTTNPGILRRCRALADELSVPLCIHMSETRTETEGNLKAHGRRPIPYCDELGLLRADTTLHHMVDVDDADLDIVRSRGSAIVHNPASNMKLASGIAPVARMLAHGIPVAIGTDGPASNNAQNMFREMYLASLLHKVADGDPRSAPAQSVLDMATLGGAAALHNPDIGSLEPGKQADFIAIDLAAPSLQPVHNVVSNIVYAANGSENRLTVVAGRELYRDGRFLTADYDNARARLRRAAEILSGR